MYHFYSPFPKRRMYQVVLTLGKSCSICYVNIFYGYEDIFIKKTRTFAHFIHHPGLLARKPAWLPETKYLLYFTCSYNLRSFNTSHLYKEYLPAVLSKSTDRQDLHSVWPSTSWYCPGGTSLTACASGFVFVFSQWAIGTSSQAAGVLSPADRLQRSTVLYLIILPELWPPVEFVWAAVNLQFSYKYIQ